MRADDFVHKDELVSVPKSYPATAACADQQGLAVLKHRRWTHEAERRDRFGMRVLERGLLRRARSLIPAFVTGFLFAVRLIYFFTPLYILYKSTKRI